MLNLINAGLTGYNIAASIKYSRAMKLEQELAHQPAPKLYINQPIDPAQRVFGVPGASLQSANLAPEAVAAGIRGEQNVGGLLEQWAAKDGNTYIFHSVQLPDGYGDIDHVVVRNGTVILVDSKMWKFGKAYDIFARNEVADYVSADGENFAGGDIHMDTQLYRFRSYYPQWAVGGILTVAHDRSTALTRSFETGYVFTDTRELEASLESMLEAAGSSIGYQLDESIVRMFADLVISPALAMNGGYAPEDVAQAHQPVGMRTPAISIVLFILTMIGLPLSLITFVIGTVFSVPFIIASHVVLGMSKKRMWNKGLTVAALVFSYVSFVISLGLSILTVFLSV